MPLGNGPPLGLPSAPLGVFSDPRHYDTPHAAAGETGFNPITKQSVSPLSPYEKVIAATPGLAQWWPLGYAVTPTPSYYTYGNAAGATTFEAGGSGVSIVPGLVPGSRSQAVSVPATGYLWAEDYRMFPMGWETIMSVELWVKFQTIGTDSALIGMWDNSTNGWMVYSSSGDFRLYCAANNLTQASSFVTGKTYHVVCAWGGSQDPTADYLSRMYLNGVEVKNGNLVAGGHDTITTSAHLQCNAYGNSDGGNGGGTHHAFTLQHISMYNRMLQPLEVVQHYQAGFARS